MKLFTICLLLVASGMDPCPAQEPFQRPLPRLSKNWTGDEGIKVRPLPKWPSEPEPEQKPVENVKIAYDPAWIFAVKQFESDELAHGKITVSIIHPDGLKKGVWEVGYGVTQAEVNEAILFGLLPPGTKLPERMTKEEADRWFVEVTIPVYERFVNEIVTVPLTPEQRFALISFCHNLGADNLSKLTAQTGRLNDRNYQVIAEFIPLYVNAGSYKNVPGLIARRGWERLLWEQGMRLSELASR